MPATDVLLTFFASTLLFAYMRDRRCSTPPRRPWRAAAPPG